MNQLSCSGLCLGRSLCVTGRLRFRPVPGVSSLPFWQRWQSRRHPQKKMRRHHGEKTMATDRRLAGGLRGDLVRISIACRHGGPHGAASRPAADAVNGGNLTGFLLAGQPADHAQRQARARPMLHGCVQTAFGRRHRQRQWRRLQLEVGRRPVWRRDPTRMPRGTSTATIAGTTRTPRPAARPATSASCWTSSIASSPIRSTPSTPTMPTWPACPPAAA